jgi:tRNA dimethylallyltransferase
LILGPTATGKTAIAVEVARRLDGEIISADSRAFFTGLDVVTAKPTARERGGVPHHLIDRVPVNGEYDAMTFRLDVESLVSEILSRDRVPMIVGGGTLYLGAVLRGIFEGPGKDPEFRASLDGVPAQVLYGRLQRIDPPAAATIHPHDRLRIVRALEVHEASGRPISHWQADAAPLAYTFVTIGLRRDPSDHRRAIAARALAMVEAGLVEEVAQLREDGLTPDVQAARTIGVPEAWARLAGEIDDPELVDRLAKQTWALARRQLTWFRRERDVHWIDVTGRRPEDVAEEIVTRWSEREQAQ